MAITLEDVKQFLEQNKDNEDVKNYLVGLSKPTLEGVKAFLETEEGKKLLQPRLDQYFTKGLETWKQNNLQKLIDEEISRRYPQETEEQKLLKKLQADLEAEKQARVREALRNKAITIATEKGLPVALIDHFLGQDEETTLANIQKLETAFQEHVKAAVEARFKEYGRTPHPGGPGNPAPKKEGELGAELAKKQVEGSKKQVEGQNIYFKQS